MSNLVLRPAQSEDELYLAHDLMAKVHCKDYWEGMTWMDRVGRHYPGFLREHTRLAFLEGDLAGALRVTTDTVRIGEARLKMGGFGWVSTSGKHRHKGVARELMLNTVEYFREHGYHVSMLFGIPNFYHRFGFVTTLADYTTYLDPSDLDLEPASGYRVRGGKAGDIRAMQKMHEAMDDDTSCSIIRCAAHFSHQWRLWEGLRVVTNASGTPVGYFLAKDAGGCLTIREVGVQKREHCETLLQAIGREARAHYRHEIAIVAPPSHPFVQYLMRYRSRHEMRVTQNEGGMMAVVNTAETLESMIPEWEQSLVGNGLGDARVEVTLLVNRKPWRVRANRGAIDIAAQSGSNKFTLDAGELMLLISGYRYFDEIFSQQRRMVSADGRALLGAMFPKRTPFVWPMDRF